MRRKITESTYFIEEYAGNYTGLVTIQKPQPIKYYAMNLEYTQKHDLIHTVAIFLIFPKSKHD